MNFQQLRKILPTIGALAALLACAPVPAQDCASYQRDRYEGIRGAREFSVTILGDPEHTPQAQFELRCILKRADSVQVLKALLGEATPAGQMFTMTGLMLISPPDARRAQDELRKADPLVTYSSGDIIRQEKASALIDYLEQGLARRIIEPRKDVPAELSSFQF